jgi:AAA+ superfamily predicted ATPase
MSGVQAVEGRLFLIGATHDPALVDEGVLSFFQERMHLAPPNRELRRKLLTNLLSGKKLGFSLHDGSIRLADLKDGDQATGG